MSDGRDPGVDQLQSVLARGTLGLCGKAGPMQNAIQVVAGAVACKHPPRPIGTMSAGRERHDQQFRRRIAKGRNRSSPILPIAIGAALNSRDFTAVRDETRTFLTRDNSLIEDTQALSDTICGMHTPFRLDGKIALVTGGASGIGEATCRALSAAGAAIVVVDVNQERAQKLSSELPGSRALTFDITDEPAVARNFAELGPLDILINNAGIGLVGGVEETELADFQRIFRVNVDGLFLVTKYAMPLLLKSAGSIVNLASVAGMVGVKRRFAYCGTKGAVIAMTRQIAVDYPTQIRINCICPGTVDTPFVEGYLQKYHAHEVDKMRAELNQRQPVGRLGQPDEIASLILFLCSKEAQFINGASIPIDGGWTAA